MPTVEGAILAAGLLLLAAVLAARLSDKLRVPSLLLFLAVGMLAGSEGIGGIEFDSPDVAQSIGTVALVVILFSGGLDTRWAAVRPVLAPGLVLATLGVVATALLLGSFAWLMLGSFTDFDFGSEGLGWTEALLLGAIVSSTDAAAVFATFRTSPVVPFARIRHLLELESGSNDPMAVILTTTLLGALTAGVASITEVAGDLVLQVGLGAACGLGVGVIGAALVDRLSVSAQGLYPIVVLAIGLIGFGLADVVGGNGFLAVYLAGLVVGNRVQVERARILDFHDALSWLAQIAMFLVLGLLVVPSELLPLAAVAITIALFLVLVARPVAVMGLLLPFRQPTRETAYVSWAGLKGAVPIVLATFPATYALSEARDIFNLVFFIVVTSALLQGLTLVPSARVLGVAEQRE